MKKVLVLLLIVGILVGTVAVVEDTCQEYSSGNLVVFTGNELTEDSPGDPSPCGGEADGGGGVPG